MRFTTPPIGTQRQLKTLVGKPLKQNLSEVTILEKSSEGVLSLLRKYTSLYYIVSPP